MEDPAVAILGVPLPILSHEGALERLERALSSRTPAHVFYVNAHTLNLARRDPAFAGILGSASLLLNDGIGVAIAARLAGRPMLVNLNGSDFNPLILRRAAERRWRVFFVGGRDGVAEAAAARLADRIPGLNIVGVAPGYLDGASSETVVKHVRASRVDLLMVGMGSPIQERWLVEHLAATGARLGITAGGFFDFASGTVPRAPAWMNRAGVEWCYRLMVEPRRLWRRYLVGNPRFLAYVLAARLRGSSLAATPERRS